MPTSQRPSRTCPGRGLRRFQPKRSAPTRRHCTNSRFEKGWPAAFESLAAASGLRPCGSSFDCSPLLSGTTWVSLRMRSSTGSMASFSASSSMAASSARWPVASPGARMAFASGKSSTASRVAVIRFAPAYNMRVCWTAPSGLPSGWSPDQLSCAIAVILPSGVAPRRTRWMVAGRCVVLLATSARCRLTFTGRRAACAPRAASSASARTNSLEPKPPPTKGETTRTLSLGMPSVRASSLRPSRPSGWRSTP
jgi:hypothetical protein